MWVLAHIDGLQVRGVLGPELPRGAATGRRRFILRTGDPEHGAWLVYEDEIVRCGEDAARVLGRRREAA